MKFITLCLEQYISLQLLTRMIQLKQLQKAEIYSSYDNLQKKPTGIQVSETPFSLLT